MGHESHEQRRPHEGEPEYRRRGLSWRLIRVGADRP